MSRPLRTRIRVFGLLLSGLIAVGLAVQLLLVPGTFGSTNSLPLVAVFLVIAGVSVVTAVRVWTHSDPPT